MARFDFTVDTGPMANKMKDVSSNVEGVSTAVVAMQTAVIAAETQATEFLCRNVNEGFYQLVMSQIAQKCAAAQSETQAYAMELEQQKQALLALKSRMESDFNMIAQRNAALFNSLNIALHNRVAELDKFTMNFVTKDIMMSVNRVNRLVASVPVNQSESLAVSQKIAAGKIKENACMLIRNMKNYLTTFNLQRHHADRVIVDKRVEKAERTYIPSIVAEMTNENVNRKVDVFVPRTSDFIMEKNLEEPLKYQVERNVERQHWMPVGEEEYARVTGEFNHYMAQEEIPERVADLMQKLYKQSKWQIIKEG